MATTNNIDIIIRASKNRAFIQSIMDDKDGNPTRMNEAEIHEYNETATAQESALTAIAEVINLTAGTLENPAITIFTGENTRIRYYQIRKLLRNGVAISKLADEIESHFTERMRKLTIGERNAIAKLAEVVGGVEESDNITVNLFNVRRLRYVQLTQKDGKTYELETLVGKEIELINKDETNNEGEKIVTAVVKGHENIVSENNTFGVGGGRKFTVTRYARGFSFDRATDPHDKKKYSELTSEEKDDYKGTALIRLLCDKELEEFLPRTEAKASKTVEGGLKALLAC